MVRNLWQSKAWYVSWSLDSLRLGLFLDLMGLSIFQFELGLGPLAFGYNAAWDCPIDLEIRVKPDHPAARA